MWCSRSLALLTAGGVQERRKPFAVKASAKPPAPQPSALEQFETAAADTPTPAAAQHDAAVSQQQQQANFSNEVCLLSEIGMVSFCVCLPIAFCFYVCVCV